MSSRSGRIAGAWRLAPALALLAACADPQPRNVLLVSIDSLRADHLGSYGHPRDTSPTIDRLAAGGARFENASSATSWTLPAHATLLTGRLQRSHRTITVADAIPETEELLSEVFTRAGFETVGFYSGPFLHPAFGFAQGFERYVSCQPEESRRLAAGERVRRPAVWEHAHGDRTNPIVVEAFERWLAERSARPFFAFVHLWDVHYDYLPPPRYAALFDDGYEGPLDGRDIQGEGFPLDASARDVAHLRALYDAEIRATDAALGEMLARLDAAGWLRDTLVVVTADHGEEFLEHGGKGHIHTLYQELIRVPLIFWGPGVPARSVATPVSLADVSPTILDLLRVEGLTAADGRSLRPLIEGRREAELPVFSTYYDMGVMGGTALRRVALRLGDRKVIHEPAGDRWVEFDLRADPGEREGRPVDPMLRALLAAEAARAADALAGRADADAQLPAGLPPAQAEQLRDLGYLD